ncbi:MAG TPA: PIG-L family deacetylase [Desulfomonilaceae bacterium]|nr:PIG-L family deacetylase [Desulfomonilaceae bacterium]
MKTRPGLEDDALNGNPHLSTDLFLFAHPDDDVFVAGTMSMLVKAGHTVHAAWLTSGDARGDPAMREAELCKAMRIVGVAESGIHLLRLPNRGLLGILPTAAEKVAKIVVQLNPERIFTTAYEGGHIDHDALNFLTRMAYQQTGSRAGLYEFPLYNRSGPFYFWWWRINTFYPCMEEVVYSRLTETAVRIKHLAMREYASQWKDMLPFRLVLNKKRMLQTGEPYRQLPPDRDYTVPPHAGKLNYEGWSTSPTGTTFIDFRKAVADFCSEGNPRP